MTLQEHKITPEEIAENGVVAADDILSGNAQENKAVFDRLVREIVSVKFNEVIDILNGSEGAAEIGAVDPTVNETSSVQDALDSLKRFIEEKAIAAGYMSFNGRDGAVVPEEGDYNADQITETESRKFVDPEEYGTLKNDVDTLKGDYIVEQGTSDDWYYRKWNSGIAECWGAITKQPAEETANHGLSSTVHLSKLQTITLPFKFVKFKSVVATCTNYAYPSNITYSNGAAYIYLRLIRPTTADWDGAAENKINVVATGTWK